MTQAIFNAKDDTTMNADISKIRQDYSLASLETDDLAGSPLDQLQRWLQEAISAELPEPNAMTLSTVKADGRPSARIVLARGVDAQGVTFFTNYRSHKGQALLSNPWASLTFYWAALERQVRIEGRVEKLSSQASDDYYLERPVGSRLGAWASPQSQVIPNRAWLEARHETMRAQFGDAPPRPSDWGGYRLAPDRAEFWQGRPSRLHDRLAYSWSNPEAVWQVSRLAP